MRGVEVTRKGGHEGVMREGSRRPLLCPVSPTSRIEQTVERVSSVGAQLSFKLGKQACGARRARQGASVLPLQHAPVQHAKLKKCDTRLRVLAAYHENTA